MLAFDTAVVHLLAALDTSAIPGHFSVGVDNLNKQMVGVNEVAQAFAGELEESGVPAAFVGVFWGHSSSRVAPKYAMADSETVMTTHRVWSINLKEFSRLWVSTGHSPSRPD